MGDRYLQHIPSKQIFIWQPAFASREDFVEVLDLQGTPLPSEEDLQTPETTPETPPAEAAAPKAKSKKKPDVTASELDALLNAEAALSADASRGA